MDPTCIISNQKKRKEEIFKICTTWLGFFSYSHLLSKVGFEMLFFDLFLYISEKKLANAMK